jgi:transposase
VHRKKSKANRSKSVNFQALPVINADAAGIDVGAKEHLVAVPCDRDPQPIRTFQAFTPELHELAGWLKRCGIKSVALESTGIYWLSLYEVLEEYGFEGIRLTNHTADRGWEHRQHWQLQRRPDGVCRRSCLRDE